MSKNTSGFTILEKDLAQALEITQQRLDEIIDFFDSDDKDEWELKEGDHYIYTNKKLKERIFSQQGAFAIAKYMDSIEKKSLWDQIKEFVTQHKAKLRNAFIRQKIHENCSSLTSRNNQHFLSKKDTVNIFCTSYARLNKAFLDIKNSPRPLEMYVDFDEIEGERFYSLAGFSRLSKELSQTLTVKDRKAWCGAVDIVGVKTLKLIIDEQTAREQRITKAKSKAKTRDKSTCQITLRSASKYDKFKVAAHHIFSTKDHPHLADCLDNLITLDEAIHQEFHVWNGGNQAPCDTDKLIKFITERYPDDSEKALMRLYKVKQIFGSPSVSVQPKQLEDQSQQAA